MVAIIRDVLGEAIQAGGSTLKDFRHSDGELGYFQHTFKVYGREGEACTNTDCECENKAYRPIWTIKFLLSQMSKIA